ncbi:2714_t:CDS:2 [Rhizophagus irregularis]|nr:2714_t:CDS:2 [Rhizophagus irregularis]
MSGNSRKKKVELSGTLKQWLEPRIRLKLRHQKGLTNEQARVDIIKDTCIKILSPLPLNVFASAISRLAQIDEMDRLYLIERLLNITPNPDMVTGERANDLREFLVATLSPSNADANGATTIEVAPPLMDVAKSVLQQSHRDWIGTREALSTFLKECTAKFNSEKNVYMVYPHLSDISRKLFLEKEQRTGVEYFFACIQNVADSMGYKFKDLIKIDVPPREGEKVKKLMNEFFPKGIRVEDDDCINDPNNNVKRRIRPPLLRPRWHNQQHMMLLALQNSPDYTLARGDLIDAAISLDEKLSAVTGLPRCFTGQTPRNSASACLTTNADKYFTVFKKDPNSHTNYYKLSFIPNDLDDAIKHYRRWMNDIIEHDWPLCFGKPKKLKTVQNSGHIVMLSVGAVSNPLHSRCRRCVAESSCDTKLPACGKCKSRGHLCIYPFRAATATRNKKKLQQQIVEQQKRMESGDPDACRASLPDEILDGLDLSNVPKSLDDVVEVRLSTIPNAGNGLFAKRNLPIGTPLGFYFGVPMMEDEFDERKDKVGKASHYSMRYKHTILDATDEKGEPFTKRDGPIFCPFHFMNEDPFGNMVFLEGSEVNQVICWTKRDIKKGEELFVYYGGDVDREHWGQAENSEQVNCVGDRKKRRTTPNKNQRSKKRTKRAVSNKRKKSQVIESEFGSEESIEEAAADDESMDYNINMYDTPPPPKKKKAVKKR